MSSDPSRRDDLESLIYVVLFLYYGQLPWHHGAQQLAGRERLDYVIRMKQDLDIRDYGDEIPRKFTQPLLQLLYIPDVALVYFRIHFKMLFSHPQTAL